MTRGIIELELELSLLHTEYEKQMLRERNINDTLLSPDLGVPELFKQVNILMAKSQPRSVIPRTRKKVSASTCADYASLATLTSGAILQQPCCTDWRLSHVELWDQPCHLSREAFERMEVFQGRRRPTNHARIPPISHMEYCILINGS
jgi:hypothetical protein